MPTTRSNPTAITLTRTAYRTARLPRTITALFQTFVFGTLVFLALALPKQALAQNVCFATADDGVTVYPSPDSQAVRDAVADAISNSYDTVKIAGYCAGTTLDEGTNTTQVTAIDGELTLVGGYTDTDWSASYPVTQPTTLDALNDGRVLYATQPLTVENLIVQSGQVTNANGGGIYADSDLILIDSQISNSVATSVFLDGRGGGVYVFGNLTITGTSFTRNAAQQGGGAFANGSAAITGASFLSNTANNAGGGVFVINTATITGTNLLSNTAGVGGGGAYLPGGSSSITDTTFTANLAAQGGGAFVFGSADSVQNSRFISNMATDEGGALFIVAGNNFVLRASQLLHNSAVNGGGAIYLSLSNNVQLENNIFAGNSSTNNGQDIDIGSESEPSSIFGQHNTFVAVAPGAGPSIIVGREFSGQSINLRHSIFHNYGVGVQSGPNTSGATLSGVLWSSVLTPTEQLGGGAFAITNEYTDSAALANPAVDDYHLGMGSAAINRAMGSTTPTDFEGEVRPQQGAADLGADESPYVAGVCFATADDGTTLFGSYDGQAVRDAIAEAVNKGYDTVRIAGYCAGVAYNSEVGDDAVAVVTTSLSLLGGYTQTDWSASYPVTQPTVLDAKRAGHVIYATAPLIVRDFTVINGSLGKGYRPSLGAPVSDGAGIYASGPLTMTVMKVFSNTSSGYGAGVYADALWMDNSEVAYNGAGNEGGGIYVAGSGGSYAPTIVLPAVLNAYVGNSDIHDNYAGAGGGMAAYSAQVSNTVFRRNEADFLGGGLFVFSYSDVQDTQFVGNISYDSGFGCCAPSRHSAAYPAAVRAQGRWSKSADANQPTIALVGGGGAWLGYADVSGSQFVSNTAFFAGAGVFLDAGGALTDSQFISNVIEVVQPSAPSIDSVAAGAGLACGLTGVGNAPQDVGELWLSAVTFEENYSGGIGGGVASFCDTYITDSDFISNTAIFAGGGAMVQSAIALITGTEFVYNTVLAGNLLPQQPQSAFVHGRQTNVRRLSQNMAQPNANAQGEGGGAWLDADQTRVTGSRFEQNFAEGEGGGLFAYYVAISDTVFVSNAVAGDVAAQLPLQQPTDAVGKGGGASLTGGTIERTQFGGNQAQLWGGGLIVYDSTQISQSSFIDNVAMDGGALDVEDVDAVVDVVNSVFVHNSATSGGGAAIWTIGSLALLHDTVAATAEMTSSAIYVDQADLALTNTIVVSHNWAIDGAGPSTILGSHNLLASFTADTVITDGMDITLTNGLTGDPQFNNLNGHAATDFRTSANSLAVDSGLDIGVKNDYSDAPRPQGMGPDVGAFETQATAELGIGGFATPNVSRPGAPMTISVVAVNTGPNTAYDVVITMSVGAGLLSPVCQSTPACVSDGQVMTVTLAQLVNNGTHTIVINGIVDPTIQDDATIVVSTGIQALRDVNASNNYAEIRASVGVIADIVVEKRAESSTVLAGQRITYTAVITNLGPGVAHTVLFTDALPGTMQALQCQADSGATCTVSFGKAMLNLATLAVNATQIVTLSGQTSVNAAQGAVVVNTADVSAQNDITVTNNSSSVTVTVQTLADLHLSITDAPDPVPAGGLMAYVISVTNSGPNPARNVSVSGVQTGGTVGGVVSSQGNCNALPCTLGTLGVNATARVTVSVTAPNTAGVISHDASATTDTPLAGAAPSATAQTTVLGVASADVVISKRASARSIVAGTRVTYTVVVTNLGPSVAQSVRVTDVLNSLLQAPTCSSTSGGVCTIAGSTVVVTFGSLPVNQPQTILIAAGVPPSTSAGTVVTNGVASLSSTPDPNTANGGGGLMIVPPEATFTVRVESDLSATIHHVGGLSINQPGKFEIVVANKGPSDAKDVTVTANLPTGFVFVSNTAVFVAETASATWICSANGQIVTCRTASLPASVSTTDKIVLNVNVTDGAPLQATTMVVISSGSPDPIMANNSSDETTPVDRPTAIVLERFVVEGNWVLWTTSAEVNTFGFHVLRSKTGARADAEVITPALIAARGRQGGASYVFKDVSADPNIRYTYWLQEVELDGTLLAYGPAISGVGNAESGNHTLFVPMMSR